ncbi:MAG: hypothetical protein ACLFWD_13755, partial [Anaerolineales bacterium]
MEGTQARFALSTRWFISLALISAAMLAYEIGLTRLFAVQQFHHFAFMVVSLALLGMAASGIALSLRERQPRLGSLALFFILSLALSYALINLIPFDSYAIAWDADQVWVLLLYFTAAALPFFFAGWAAGLGLAMAGERTHLPYAAIMAGSALGAPIALLIHQIGGALSVTVASAGMAAIAAILSSQRSHTRFFSWGLLIASSVVLLLRPSQLLPTLSDYKPLAVAKNSLEAQVALTKWGPVSRLDVVEGAATHVMPGLSVRPGVDLPGQIGLYLDGEGPFPISEIDPESERAQTLADRMPSTVAARLRPGADQLILQPGAGLEAQLALARGGTAVIARDDPLVLSVLPEEYLQASESLLMNSRLQVNRWSTRGALADPDVSYGLIQYALSDPFRPIQSGAFSLTENYTLTQQSFQAAFQRLEPDGILSISRWLSTPPSESARAWATLHAALQAEGVEVPGDHLAAFRGLRTATMIASRQPFRHEELGLIRRTLEENGWDPVYLPDLNPDEVNQQNVLPEPVYADLFTGLVTEPDETIAAYEFRLAPPQDQRPYFFHFFRWRQTPQVLRSLGQTMQPFGGSGYLVLLALLGLMILLSLPMVLIPWWALKRRGLMHRLPWRTTAYFGALGAGYLLIEIPLISQLILLLERPALALGTVLFTILLASSLGSLLSPRWRLKYALAAVIGVSLATMVLLPRVLQFALAWALPARLLVAVTALLPLGFVMGVPFAAGLRRLEAHQPGLIPWAWG